MGTLDDVVRITERYPLSTAREISLALASDAGIDMSVKAVRELLRAHPEHFLAEGGRVSRWRAIEQPLPPVGDAPAVPPGLRAWQLDALAAWRVAERRGVVDAVSGSGKTHVGLGAIHETLLDGGRSLVIVPTVELLKQWHTMTREVLPYARIARIGGGRDDNITAVDVVLCVAGAAISRAVASSAKSRALAPRGGSDLLIVDEARSCGSPALAQALKPEYDRRLGLDAPPLSDTGLPAALTDYFGRIVYTCDHAQASAEEALAPLRLAVVGVPFSPLEQSRYDKLWDSFATLAQATLGRSDITPAVTGEVVGELTDLAGRGIGGSMWARRGLSAAADIRDVLSRAVAKRTVLDLLPPADGGTVIFTRDTADAEDLAARWRERGVVAGAVHGKVPGTERSANLEDFRDQIISVICAAGGIEPGLNLPAADLGVMLSMSQDSDQLLRRIGSVWRGKPDGRPARIVLAYVEGTVEDPAHGGFGLELDLLTPLADEIASFRVSAAPHAVTEFLLDGGPRPIPALSPVGLGADTVRLSLSQEQQPHETDGYDHDLAAFQRGLTALGPDLSGTSPSLEEVLSDVLAAVSAVIEADVPDTPASTAGADSDATSSPPGGLTGSGPGGSSPEPGPGGSGPGSGRPGRSRVSAAVGSVAVLTRPVEAPATEMAPRQAPTPDQALAEIPPANAPLTGSPLAEAPASEAPASEAPAAEVAPAELLRSSAEIACILTASPAPDTLTASLRVVPAEVPTLEPDADLTNPDAGLTETAVVRKAATPPQAGPTELALTHIVMPRSTPATPETAPPRTARPETAPPETAGPETALGETETHQTAEPDAVTEAIARLRTAPPAPLVTGPVTDDATDAVAHSAPVAPPSNLTELAAAPDTGLEPDTLTPDSAESGETAAAAAHDVLPQWGWSFRRGGSGRHRLR